MLKRGRHAKIRLGVLVLSGHEKGFYVSAGDFRRRVTASLFITLLLAMLSVALPSAQASEIDTAHEALYVRYAQRLEQLASWCDGQQLAEQAEIARSWLPPYDRDVIHLFVLDDRAASSSASSDSPSTNTPLGEWRKEFQTLRRAQATELFGLARQAAEARRPSLAIRLLTETVREDPDHAEARRILGYVKYDDAWCRPYEKKMRRRGFVWHEQFCWLKASDVARYEAGERRNGHRWVSREEDLRRHQAIELGWQIDTAHYRVTTNHSLEEGVRLASQLEQLRQIWRQLFAEYYLRRDELAQAFAGHRLLRGKRAPMQVVYYRTRDEYNDQLRPAQPKIDMTLGIYLDSSRRAYFFAGEDQHAGTLHHEATHQLFHETRPVVKNVGLHNNFWIVEGIATHIESLTRHGSLAATSYFTLGGENDGRIPAARHRLLEDGFYVPLGELTALGMDDIQQHADIAKLYSQSAGLAAFLIHYDAGRYRAALERYLVAVYTGKADAETLAELTGRTYEELDLEYRRFLESGSPEENSQNSGE